MSVFAIVYAGCGGDGPPGGPSTPEPLGPVPVLLSPADNEQVSTDTPTLTVRNAQGFDAGQAQYAFRVTTASGTREIASGVVPAGSGRTSVVFAAPLPRGMTLGWSVEARSATAAVASASATFRLPAVACVSGAGPYAKSVVEWNVPPCNLEHNVYNDPNDVLGAPDGGGTGQFNFFGILSLGREGHVTVDMEACAQDLPGPDIRVFQFVGTEFVTLYAGGSPTGPFQQLAYRRLCGNRVPGFPQRRTCDFDLAEAEVQEARYFKVEDGELYDVCPGDTPSEGTDIDAVQILSLRP